MMSSPVVDCVREIPLIVERDYPMQCDKTGFPFDDDREDSDASFRSQLDDIAARHPEFAHHLGSFPFRSGARPRAHIPEEFSQHFTERPFPDRFERFGFPFDEAEDQNKPYYQRYPHYYPQDAQESQDQPCSSGKEDQPENTEVKEEEGELEESGRGRKLKNIQQSNTVDLGQRQEPVNDRNQRSMSAPPPNNRQRFVSSINIPVNQPKTNSNMPQNVHQPSAPPQPQERVIPIHVEGRDEPILPKKASASTSQPQPQSQHPQPPTDRFFTQKSPNFSQYFNRDQNFQNNWFPKNFQNKQPQSQTSFSQNQRGRSPQPQAKQEPTEQHQTNVPKQPNEAQQEPQQQVLTKHDPIDQIKSIQKDVSELMAEVDKFDGQPRDKKYLYLDEMLTRNLIKLDNIDTQGQENIRSARKEAIKCIEKCISILESKANSNLVKAGLNLTQESNEMEVEKVEDKTSEATVNDRSNIPESDNNEISQDTKDEKMEVDAEKSEKNEAPEIQNLENSSDKLMKTNSEQKMDTSESTQGQEKTDLPSENKGQIQNDENLETNKSPPANIDMTNESESKKEEKA